MEGSIRFVTVDVRLTGPNVSTALDQMLLEPGAHLDLGDGASTSRAILLSDAPVEILNVVADVTTIVASVAMLANWLHRLLQHDGVVVERIGRTVVEHITTDEIVRVLHEEIVRKVESPAKKD
jgi:hypothetical protein